MNFLLLTYDSCRYDVLLEAHTPVLDSYAEVRPAQTPANFTYPAHQAFFAGILPNTLNDEPYYNRFSKQLLGLREVGEGQVVKDSLLQVASDRNLVAGLRGQGFQTVGCGAMNWFRQKTLQTGFEHFRWTGRGAYRQIEYLLEHLDPARPFFGFINFGETHFPFTFEGKTDRCPVDIRARRIIWPPKESGPVGRDNPGYAQQIAAAEFLDSCLPQLFSSLPGDTVVILTADHGECFGEDGYLGHGFNHPKVLEVPLAIFHLDGHQL